MVKHLLRSFVLAAFLVAAAQSSAFAGEKSFTIINLSGKTFYRLYICQSDVDGGVGAYQDHLSNILRHGEQVVVIFPEGAQHVKYWDITIEFKDDDRWFWRSLDLLNVSKIVVKDGKLYRE